MKTTWNMRTTITVLRVLRPAADGSFQRRKRFAFLFSSSATSPARMCSDLGAREALCLSFQFRPPDNSQWQDAESKDGVFFAPGNRPCGALTSDENNATQLHHRSGSFRSVTLWGPGQKRNMPEVDVCRSDTRWKPICSGQENFAPRKGKPTHILHVPRTGQPENTGIVAQ